MTVYKNFMYEGLRTKRPERVFVYEPIGDMDDRRFSDALSKWKNIVWKNRENMMELVRREFDEGIGFQVDGNTVSIIFESHPDFRFERSGKLWRAFSTKELRAMATRTPHRYDNYGSVVTNSYYEHGTIISVKPGMTTDSVTSFVKTGHIPTAIEVTKFLNLVVTTAKRLGLV